MLIETIAVKNGYPLNISWHNQRFNRSRKELFNAKTSINLAPLLKDAPKDGLYRCRILYNAKGVDSVTYHKYKPKSIQKIKLLEIPKFNYSYKYADRRLFAELFKIWPDADEFIITQNGYLTDSTISNIAIYIERVWFTPDTPLLPGTTRARFIKLHKIYPKSLHFSKLAQADSLAFINAMLGLKPIFDPYIY